MIELEDTTCTDTAAEILTFEILARTVKAFFKPLYYAVSEYISEVNEDGTPVCFCLPASEYSPEMFVCHPNNLEWAMTKLSGTGRPLVNLKEHRPQLRLPMLLVPDRRQVGRGEESK